MKKISTRNLVMIAMLSGLSYLFFMWEFKIVDPLQFDLSDLFVVIAGYTMGIVPGIIVAAIKNIIHLFLRNSQVIGEVTNFVYAIFLMMPLVVFKPKNIYQRLLVYVLTILVVTVSINVFNYFIAMPIYQIPQQIRWSMIVSTFIPFNIIKTSVLIFIFATIYPFLDRLSA